MDSHYGVSRWNEAILRHDSHTVFRRWMSQGAIVYIRWKDTRYVTDLGDGSLLGFWRDLDGTVTARERTTALLRRSIGRDCISRGSNGRNLRHDM